MSGFFQWLVDFIRQFKFFAVVLPWERAIRVRLGNRVQMWEPREFDASGNRRFSTFARPTIDKALASKLLTRKTMKRKPRRPKPGDEPAYKAFVKSMPCVVGGLRCGPADPHHMIDGRGEARKGMAQTAGDRFLLPLCRAHHEDLHAVDRGFCAGWSKEKKRAFQEAECDRMRALWAEYQETGLLIEPLQQTA